MGFYPELFDFTIRWFEIQSLFNPEKGTFAFNQSVSQDGLHKNTLWKKPLIINNQKNQKQ